EGNDTREKLRLNFHSLGVSVSELLEYGLPISRYRYGYRCIVSVCQEHLTVASDASDLFNIFFQPLVISRIIQSLRTCHVIFTSSLTSVVNYGPRGHYNCHQDSDEIDKETRCCFLDDYETTDCRICRYLTVLYFLNDVEEGGETAFPIADNETYDDDVRGPKHMPGHGLPDGSFSTQPHETTDTPPLPLFPRRHLGEVIHCFERRRVNECLFRWRWEVART
ncbi:transmembrane prolyl 4-hydroxylase-like, partial [Paramuricea clavata]